MLQQPKRTAYRKQHKGRIGRIAQRGFTVAFGDFGMKALEGTWITARQMEAVRVVITRAVKRAGGILWVRTFPDKVITQKPAEVRMGSGKGSPSYYVAVVKAGTILYEIAGVSKELAKQVFLWASKKLSIKTTMVVSEDYEDE